MSAHKRVFTDKELEDVAKYALAGCYDKTIARLTGIPETTLKERLRDLIAEKRAERKYNIRDNQNKLAIQHSQMAIFLGKNDLGQTDRQDINLGGNVSIVLEREKKELQD